MCGRITPNRDEVRLHAVDGTVERGSDDPLHHRGIRGRLGQKLLGQGAVPTCLVEMTGRWAHGCRRYNTVGPVGKASSGSLARIRCRSTGVVTPAAAWYAARAS